MTDAMDLPVMPDWMAGLFGLDALPAEGGDFAFGGRALRIVRGIPRSREFVSEAQDQTRETFGFKWANRDSFEANLGDFLASWLKEKYGDIANAPWWADYGDCPIVLDAGCGASLSGIGLLGSCMDRIRYVGVDVSTAVDVAAQRFTERGMSGAFLQSDLMQLPLPPASVDVIFSEGVLHHTDDTQAALAAVTRHLKVGGRIMFYVYRKKGPIREFTDDYIRGLLQDLPPAQAWEAMMSLTLLGKTLGELDIEVEIDKPVELLDIPAGRMPLQRLFYWHIFKAFYREDMTVDEMNHINYDWYAPRNAHRQTEQDVREWCAALNLAIEHECIEPAGITIIAQKKA